MLGGAILTSEAINEEFYKRRPAPHRPVAVAVQRLGPGQGPGDPGPARAPPDRARAAALADVVGPAQGGQAGARIRSAPDHPRPRHRQGPDERRRNRDRPGPGRARGGLASSSTPWRSSTSPTISGDAKSMATHPPTTTHRSVPEEQRPAAGRGRRRRAPVGRPGKPRSDLTRDVIRALRSGVNPPLP